MLPRKNFRSVDETSCKSCNFFRLDEENFEEEKCFCIRKPKFYFETKDYSFAPRMRICDRWKPIYWGKD